MLSHWTLTVDLIVAVITTPMLCFTSCWALVASCRTEFHPWEWWSWRHRCTARPPPAAWSRPPLQTPWTMAKLTVNNGVHITAPGQWLNWRLIMVSTLQHPGQWPDWWLIMVSTLQHPGQWPNWRLIMVSTLQHPGQWPNWRLIMVSTLQHPGQWPNWQLINNFHPWKPLQRLRESFPSFLRTARAGQA